MNRYACSSSIALFFASLIGSEIGRADDPVAAAPRYESHDDFAYYLRHDGTRAEIRTTEDWKLRRRHILAGMQRAMGALPQPSNPVPLAVEILEEHQADGLLRRKLAYHTERADYKLKAWLLLPVDSTSKAPRAAVLCLHQTTPRGKDAPVGLADRPSMHYALELARRGYVTLSPDYPSFGEHDYDFESDDYASGSMKAICDNIRAIDLLQSLPEVDPDKIGCIGHSLGGHNALFTAVFDQRIQAVVTSCGFTRFHKYKGGDLHGWSSSRYMPRIATYYGFSPDRMPFDFPEVLAAIAPRAVFIVAPLHDNNFEVTGVRDCVTAAQPVYKLLGHADRLQAIFPDFAHDFPDAARSKAYTFFDQELNQKP